MSFETHDARDQTKEIQAEFAAKGDALGWFDALYKEANTTVFNLLQKPSDKKGREFSAPNICDNLA